MNVVNNTEEDPPIINEVPEKFFWGEVKGSEIINEINECYDKIVFWKKIPSCFLYGASGKGFIREITKLLNAFSEGTPLKYICMKAIHIMPSLLLQKPSKSSKAKDHVRNLERRLLAWQKGDIRALFDEASTIQARLPDSNGKRDIGVISKKFKDLMQMGNINAALKLLTSQMSGGILPLDEENLKILLQKHPDDVSNNEGIALYGPKNPSTP